MRRVFCFFLCLGMVFVFCSCKSGREESVFSAYSDIVTAESEQTLSEQTQTSSEAQVSSVVQPSSSQPVQSTTPSSSTPAPVQSAPPQTPSITVPDPDNTRGLSTERFGFSFGVASGGVPHNQSVLNQQKFDSLENVSALALDTKTQEKVMYLTFDNGYEYKNLTANILDTLKAKGVKAAFFITLSYAKNNKTLVRRMIDEGHIVGNHSANHPSFPAISRTKMAEEIATLEKYLKENFNYTSPYFRFPSGEYSHSALDLVTSIGYKSVFWSVAYSDWDTSAQMGADYAYETVTSRFHPGAVILLHAVSQDNADALARIIDKAITDGYSFKTLDDYYNR